MQTGTVMFVFLISSRSSCQVGHRSDFDNYFEDPLTLLALLCYADVKCMKDCMVLVNIQICMGLQYSLLQVLTKTLKWVDVGHDWVAIKIKVVLGHQLEE
jgi:hypothetical protein